MTRIRIEIALRGLVLLAVLALVLFLAAPVFAQPVRCFHPLHWTQIMQRLGETVREKQERTILSGAKVTILLWVNEKTGSYTLSGVRPDGAICGLGGAYEGYQGQTIDQLFGPDGEAA